jgi:hypothetical protein
MKAIPMKRLLIVLAVHGLSAALSAQSLAELAKRETERRESLRGRQAVVITNRDLLRVKKVAAIEVTRTEETSGDETTGSDPGSDPAGLPDDAGSAAEPAALRSQPGIDVPADAGPEAVAEGGGPLEDQLRVVDEVVENLTTEMNALQQQLEAQNTMVPASVIQQQMGETNQRLEQAKARQAGIRAKMDRQGLPVKRSPAPEIR